MELYTVTINNALVWHFTSNEQDVILDDGNGNDIVYKAIPISRKELSKELQVSNFSIDAPINIEPFNKLSPSTSVIPIQIQLVKHPEGIIMYQGNVLKTTHDYKRGKVNITLQSRFMELNGEIPRKSYSTTCSYKLGDKDCRVDLESLKITLNSGDFTLDGGDIIADALGNAPDETYYTAGFVRANTTEVMYITAFNRDEKRISLLSRFYDNSAITSLEVYPGCSKKLDICTVRFGNQVNFGGFPYIPQRNPTLQGFR